MDDHATHMSQRRPRFRRAATPPPFRLTEGDLAILQWLARHRFLRSTHVAALIDRSIDRTNDRLARLFHAGFLDRPRAQLDFYPTSGSAPIVYALARDGARLLADLSLAPPSKRDWSRANRDAGRPFIEHQLMIIDFYVGLTRGCRARTDVQLITSDELMVAMPEATRTARNPLMMRAAIVRDGRRLTVAVVPDLIFGLRYPDGSRRCFCVEIDRGTMPVTRRNASLTSNARKMEAYLAAHAAGIHEKQFGWKTFRVLTVTTDQERVESMTDAARRLSVPGSLGAALFLFATRDQLREAEPLHHRWTDGTGREVSVM
jgi:hypothetical protein